MQFGEWLDHEISRRGWSQSELARRGGVSASAVQQVVTGITRPGPRVCQAVARAFEMPPEEVFRLAGLLTTSRPVRDGRRIVYEVNGDDLILDLWRALSPEDQAIVRDLMERLARIEPRIIGGETSGD